MARQPRFDLAGIPQHVVQRGNNRLPCFLDDGPPAVSGVPVAGPGEFDCQLHAHVLMSNHVHLLLTTVSRLMNTFARNNTGPFNGRQGRTGTCGRDDSQPVWWIQAGIFWRVAGTFELNPVRTWVVAQPADYHGSSHGANAGYREDPFLVPIPAPGAGT